MSNEHDAIFVDDSTSDDNDNEVIPVSSLRFSRPGRPDAPIEIDSDGNAEHHLFYQNSMPAPLTPNAEMAYCTNPNRLLSPNMAYANPLQASRTNGRPKKRQKSSLSPDTKKKTFMPTSLWEHNSRKSNQSSDDESAHKRILVPKTLRSASSKKIPKSRSLQPELSLSSSVRSTAHESSVRCPLCWLHFSSDLIEDHIDNCGKPEASRRSPRVIPRAPKQKILNDSSCQVGKQVYDFTSFDEDKEPSVKTNKRKASKPRRVSRRHDDEEAEEDRKLPAKPSGKGTDGSRGYPLGLRVEVEGALRNTRKAQSTSRNNLLKKMIMAKNQMLQYGKPRRLQPLPDYRRLPDIDGEILDSSYLRQEDHPLPTDAHHTIFVRKHFSSLGTEKEDDDDEDVNPSAPSPCISPALEVESWDDAEEVGEQLSPSNKQYADKIAEFRTVRIALYEEDELDQEIDEVLKLFKHSKHNRQGVHEYLAILLQVETQRVTKRWEKANGATEPRRQHDTQYEEAMSSFRDLFCRRCLIFDCNLHGLQDDYPPEIQLELAIRLENSGYWKNDPPDAPQMCLPVGSDYCRYKGAVPQLEAPTEPEIPHRNIPEISKTRSLTLEEKELCKRLYHLFQNNLGSVAQVMRIPQETIRQLVDLVPFDFQLSDPFTSSNVKSKQTKSNTYHPEWIKRIVQATSHPFFNPCTHSEQCSEETCSCIQNRFFCTKACIWGVSSRNFFRGCNCVSKCNAKSCPCLASNRECDPDLCRRCGACSDPPNKAATEQSCRNDNVGMRRHVHLLLAKSQVAGWGLYTKHPLKKGDYVHEYLGELIPQNEAERRGKIYDDRNQTYIFDMSTDYAVDALQKGNKTRFINHSDNPNIGPQMKIVNGDYRIGFFALKDIPAQSELFFDYGDKFFKATGGFMLQNSSKKKT